MAGLLSEQIQARLLETDSLYYRLVLVVGPPRSGKTKALQELTETKGWQLINVNLRLSEQLLELTQKQRSLRVARLLGDLSSATPGDVVLLDNIELLFSPELSQDPLRLLQGLSRNRTVVATWCGNYENDNLAYAEPSHPEAKRYSRPEVLIVRVEDGAMKESQTSKPDLQSGNQETA